MKSSLAKRLNALEGQLKPVEKEVPSWQICWDAALERLLGTPEAIDDFIKNVVSYLLATPQAPSSRKHDLCNDEDAFLYWAGFVRVALELEASYDNHPFFPDTWSPLLKIIRELIEDAGGVPPGRLIV